MLSRALCRYRVFALLDDPSPARRRAALDLKIAEWSPYADTARWIHENGRHAGVWIWDRATVEAAIIATGEHPGRLTVLPETVLQPRGSDGLRHVKTLEGSEAQWWVDGLMVASRWWAQSPTATEWLQFQHAAGIPAGIVDSAPRNARFIDDLPRPWVAGGSHVMAAINWRRAYLAMGAVYVVLAGVLFGTSARDYLDRSRLDHAIAEAEIAAQPRISERAEARSGLDAVKALHALDALPGQLDLFVRVTNVMPREDTRLTQWNFQNGDLEFTLASAAPLDAVSYVKAFEAVPGFSAVSVTRPSGDNALKVKLRVAS